MKFRKYGLKWVYYVKALCITFFIIADVSGQPPTLKFIHYTTKDGLPSSQTYQTFQDSKGYLWFTSDHGLIRYNGYEFKTFSTEQGLTDNTVFKVFEDRKKRLWLLTFAGGISIYENKKIHAFKYNSLVKAQINGNIPMGLYVDSADNVFITTHQLGEFKIDSSGKISQVFNFFIENDKHKIFIDEHTTKNLLISIASYEEREKPMTVFYRAEGSLDSISIFPVRQGRIHALRLKDSRRLIAVGNKIFEIKNDSAMQLNELQENILFLFEDSRKRLWAGTDKGLYIFNNTSDLNSFTYYLEGDFISSVYEDNEGSFWITTINNGIYHVGNDRIRNFVFENRHLLEPLVLTTDNISTVYAGYWTGAIAKFQNQRLVSVNTSPYRDIITCLFYDSTTTKLMVGSRKSGYLLNEHYFLFDNLNIPSMPLDFTKTRKGTIYAAGDRVVYKLENDSILELGMFTIRINCIEETEEGSFILGTNNGAFVFNEATKSLQLLSPQLQDVRIDDIEIFNQYTCFATRGKGLLLLYNNLYKWIKHEDGLASNLIHQIVVDKNTLWCATNNGISQIRFSDVKQFQYHISKINARDGLPSNEVHSMVILNDTLYAATSDGISVFSTHLTSINTVAPPIYFTSFKINDLDTAVVDNYSFPHSFNNVRIGFEALSFKSAGDIQYRYMLMNDDDSIINTTKNREAEFFSLNPGNYTFSVVAFNSSGTQSSKACSLHFIIKKPYWQQWWFAAVVFISFAFLLFMWLRRYVSRIRMQEKIETAFNKQLVQFEMKALRAQMNPHFIFNVMNSIQDYILKNDAVLAQKYLSKFARLVRLILDNSVKSEVELQEELKAAQLYVELEQQRFEQKFEFIIYIDELVDTEQIILPAMIIQPYLENAIKHGIRHLSIQGKLLLSIIKEHQNIIITIEDNGVGREASAKSNLTNVREHVSYGTVITAKRIDAYNRAFNSNIKAVVVDLKDSANQPSGTRIVVSIPIRYKPIAEIR